MRNSVATVVVWAMAVALAGALAATAAAHTEGEAASMVASAESAQTAFNTAFAAAGTRYQTECDAEDAIWHNFAYGGYCFLDHGHTDYDGFIENQLDLGGDCLQEAFTVYWNAQSGADPAAIFLDDARCYYGTSQWDDAYQAAYNAWNGFFTCTQNLNHSSMGVDYKCDQAHSHFSNANEQLLDHEIANF